MSVNQEIDKEEQRVLDELRKKQYFEVKDYFIKEENASRKWQFVTKAKVVLIMAEKLKEQDWPIFEVRDKIQEDLGDMITSPYLTKCLPDEYKKAANVKKGKKTAEQKAAKKAVTNTGSGSAATMLEEPEQELGDDEKPERQPMPNITPKLESETEAEEYEDIQAAAVSEEPKISPKYVEELENTVRSHNEELPFQDRLATVRVIKIPRQRFGKLDEANLKAKSFMMLLIDTKTQELVNAYSDTEWKKQVKEKKAEA